MTTAHNRSTVLVIGGGVVGTAIAFTLAHRGVSTIVLEAEPALALAASGTNSGILHTGFDSVPGELETELILHAARLRPAVMDALDIPVHRSGAVLIPRKESDHATIAGLAANAETNGVEASVRESDGALVVPGEWVTDPVAYTQALAASAIEAHAVFETNARVVRITSAPGHIMATTADGRSFDASYVINAAGLYADEIAALVGDTTFEVYPRKGEFFVFDSPSNEPLDQILLPVPTKRTKGVLVFPTLDGKIVAGPTASDQEDKDDWSVREEARAEVLDKAREQLPALVGAEPVASYAGLRPAGRNTNYVIEPSSADGRFINVGAIRSTGLSASLGIGDYVADILKESGLEVADMEAPTKGTTPAQNAPWWQRTATFRGLDPFAVRKNA